MSEWHTITDVDPRTREWAHPSDPQNPITYYKVQFDTHGDTGISIGRKKGSPQVGDRLYGYVKDDGKGPKFVKQDPPDGGATNTAPPHASGGNGEKSPETQRRIVRQHSQEMAIRTLALLTQMGLSGVESRNDVFEAIKKTTDWFERDVKGDSQ